MCLPSLNLIFLVTCLAVLTVTQSGGNPTRNRRPHHGATNDQYSWVCPRVECIAVPDSCQIVEYFEMQYESTNDERQTATIRCRSCDYCLDFPSSDSSRRGRRNTRRHPRHHDCTTLHCPDVPSHCNDVRMTDVYLGNTKCRDCPACYDDTVFNDRT